MTEYDALPDEQLEDMGMYRCACGSAVYPQGDSEPHCELDI